MDRNFFEMTEKVTSVRISENIKLINTVTASFYTTVRQMTEMSQQKNDRNVSAKKNNS